MHETNIQFIIVQIVAFIDEVVRNKQNQFINLLKHKYNTNLCVCHNRFFSPSLPFDILWLYVCFQLEIYLAGLRKNKCCKTKPCLLLWYFHCICKICLVDLQNLSQKEVWDTIKLTVCVMCPGSLFKVTTHWSIIE